ncbi:MAG TPA: hypothetical protein VM733_04710 [Thermoanaerobaculia bacterium]|nr:hypothetical protein [Thermoanaerobaculia bacterium]
MKIRDRIAYALSAVLIVFAVVYAVDWHIADLKFWTYHITLGGSEVFLFLALVPGVLAIVYHLVTVRDRREQNLADIKLYFAWLDDRKKERREHQARKRVGPSTTTPISANAATMLLTAVFLFVAIIAAYTKWKGTPLAGVVYAGLGAYSAVLYFMMSRLYASALSSRFLMANAIGSASAVVMGWVFAAVGVEILGISDKSFSLNAVLYLTGLFHKWAFDALRRRARKLFGQPEPETVELALSTIEGIDDVHADLLVEYGVSTVQHLATAEPGELCERTLLPMDRIADWIDQALLVAHFKKQIGAARSLGIRGSMDLVMIYDRAIVSADNTMSKLLDSLAEKTSMPRAAVDSIALKLRDDYSVNLCYALQEGKEYEKTPTADTVVPGVAQELSARYDFVNAQGNTQFEIKRRAVSGT